MTQPNGRADGPVIITNREIYNEVQQVKGIVQSMSGQAEKLADHAVKLGDHELRLRGLEKWRYALPPTLLLAVASLIIALVGGTHG